MLAEKTFAMCSVLRVSANHRKHLDQITPVERVEADGTLFTPAPQGTRSLE